MRSLACLVGLTVILAPFGPGSAAERSNVVFLPTASGLAVLEAGDQAIAVPDLCVDSPNDFQLQVPFDDPNWAVGAWTWQLLPDGILFPAYLAGTRESRFASQWNHVTDLGWVWDIALGGRVGLIRFGSMDPAWPEGWQLDVEGAAFPRLAFELDHHLVETGFRVGTPLTFRRNRWEAKLAYYHYSSHLGDEWMVRQGSFDRANYTRDVVLVGVAFRPLMALRVYGEAGWSFVTDGGSEPWEFQFGAEYSSVTPAGRFGSPFLAVNARLRQEVDFGGSFVAQAGWQWRGRSGRLLRAGAHYFNGMTDQYQFLNEHEEQIGFGLWYDY